MILTIKNNKKIVGIIFLMLVATMMVSATNINVKGNIEVTLSVADVPVWEIWIFTGRNTFI